METNPRLWERREPALEEKPEPPVNAFAAAYADNLYSVMYFLDKGADIDALDPHTGLGLIHIAIGRNMAELVRDLIRRKVKFQPDAQGRWPSFIAAYCEADDEIGDMVLKEERKVTGRTLSGSSKSIRKKVKPPSRNVRRAKRGKRAG